MCSYVILLYSLEADEHFKSSWDMTNLNYF